MSSSPDLTTCLAPGLILSSPFLAASGTFGFGTELTDLSDFTSFGAWITPTLTLQPRRGNPMPRTVEVSAGMMYSSGLPNPGLVAFVSEILPTLLPLGCSVILSILGENRDEWSELAEVLRGVDGFVGLELNLALSDLRRVESEGEALARIEGAVRAVRGATSLPLIAKLPAIGAEIGVAAQTAETAGADVISVSHAFPGVAVRLSSQQFRLPGVVGGLSGPSIKPLALYQVWRVSQAVSVPILGGGGIMTGADALEFLLAGATAVSVGISNIVHPNTIAQISAEVRGKMLAEGMKAVSEFVGLAYSSLEG